ncbi:DNA mismatch repair protein MSH7 [Nymphaea colorata]|nr:DNA mismatch repair protein MSH7 [Nymphaea colorata]
MHRQKTIFSFFNKNATPENPKSGKPAPPLCPGKPPASSREVVFARNHQPENRCSGGSSYTEILNRRGRSHSQSGLVAEGFKLAEIEGIETPPEKAERLATARRDLDDIRKFHINDGSEDAVAESLSNVQPVSYHKLSGTKVEKNIGSIEQPSSNLHKAAASRFFGNSGSVISHVEIEPNTLGPETPSTRPFVPRLKRIQDESKPKDMLNSHPSDFFKRQKPARESMVEEKGKKEEKGDFGTKYEWLNASSIRDANGRRPGDPLYDKRTLHIPPDALKKMSTTQRQYWSLKSQYMDVIIFFKVGKFYELYELDADIGHKELEWKITESGVGKCKQVGISESGIDSAVEKLLARGYKVGRMEQIETAEQAKTRGGASSVIQRKLVNVLSPSTSGNTAAAVHLLALKEENFESGGMNSSVYGFAFVDFAALMFWVGSFCDDTSCSGLGALLMHVSPKEVIYENGGLTKDTHKAMKKYASCGSTLPQMSGVLPGTDFMDADVVHKLIQTEDYFSGSTNLWSSALDGIVHQEVALSALGALLKHLSRFMLSDALRNGELLPYEIYRNSLRMDGQTLVNLEIFNNNADGGTSGTLYSYLDHCITPFGKRLLRNWICHPLQNIEEINKRLNVVEEMMNHSEIMLLIEQHLCKLSDLERLLGHVKANSGSSSMLSFPFIGEKILKQRVKVFGSLVKGLRTGLDMLILVRNDHGSLSILTYLDLLVKTGFEDLAVHLQQIETAFDDDFPHYQDHNVNVGDAETLAVLVELFTEKMNQWSKVIHALSCIDVLRSFAVTAISSSGSICRPLFVSVDSSPILKNGNAGPILRLKHLWHPYATLENGDSVVPNDILLGQDAVEHHPCGLLLTGPNMGGKSTLLRATCLAILLSQLGCYVPCETCVLSPVDVIFTRLGATDRIISGESTFFIECAETASILKYATQNSLVILDELGRGTSTFDGYAIAYAVLRHMVEKVRCRLLFATHYHPLTKEFASHPCVSLQHMACMFKTKAAALPGSSSDTGSKELVFLYKLASGACPESYGMEVAHMAGVPMPVIEAARGASQVMKSWVSKSFESSEGRSKFSTLHEDWLKSLLGISKIRNVSDDDIDALLCLWHEMKSCYK